MSKRLEFLTDDNRRCIRGVMLLLKIMAILLFVILVMLEALFIFRGVWSGEHKWAVLVPLGMVLFAFAFIYLPYMGIYTDARRNEKIIETTKVLRVKKLGWFDADTGGGMSNTLFGSIFYLYIPDTSRRSGKRKMRIKMRAYRYLKPGDDIHIEYLPKSGIILSIDCGNFHYVPWEKRLQRS